MTVRTYKGINYYPTDRTAEEIRNTLPDKWKGSSRVVKYGRGHAVQIHLSGPYVGADLNPETHRCNWCHQPGGNTR
jgi:hypothetical protein